jgi:hypothetical protein
LDGADIEQCAIAHPDAPDRQKLARFADEDIQKFSSICVHNRDGRSSITIMYGVPVDLPIERFVGDALTQVRIGIDGAHFVFSQAGIIGVFGRWQLHDADGAIIDQMQSHFDRQYYRIHVLLNAEVTDFSISPPHLFALKFSTGHQLTIYDDAPQYESCTINFECGLMIVI